MFRTEQISEQTFVAKHKVATSRTEPFSGQDASFGEQQRLHYRELLGRADHAVVVSDARLGNLAYHKRNDFLVENCCRMYAFHCGKQRSGAASTIRKAALRRVEVYNLYDGRLYCDWEPTLF